MVVGTLKIVFMLHDNRSLKGKRKVVRSIVDRLKAKFNVSVAETGANDKWQKIELGICTVGNDIRHVDSSLNHIMDFIEFIQLAQVVDVKMDIFHT
jgi:hypothetical protein